MRKQCVNISYLVNFWLVYYYRFRASSIVSGSFFFCVSGKRKMIHPDRIAVPPKTINGSAGI